MATKLEAANKVKHLVPFISVSQLKTMVDGMRSSESQYFIDKFVEYGERCETMPKTYEQDGKGDEAIAYLHYFKGSADWYITERDMESEQIQAFGLANLGQGAELGYISIDELAKAGVELDLHFEPTPLKNLRG